MPLITWRSRGRALAGCTPGAAHSISQISRFDEACRVAAFFSEAAMTDTLWPKSENQRTTTQSAAAWAKSFGCALSGIGYAAGGSRRLARALSLSALGVGGLARNRCGKE